MLIISFVGSTINYSMYTVLDGKNSRPVKGWRDIEDTCVKKIVEEFVIEIMGNEVFSNFCDQNYIDYFELCRELETKIRTVTLSSSSKLTLKMPTSLLDMAQSSNFREQLSRKECSLTADKLRLTSADFRKMFEPVCQNIIGCVKQILHESKTQDINTIILVGGLAESPILREAIKQSFQQTLIVPCEPSIALLKGAAMFGLIPSLTLPTRFQRLTQGVKIDRIFQHGDPERKKIIVNGKVKCGDCFLKLVECGQDVSMGYSSKLYYQLTSGQTKLSIPMYASLKKNPCFIDDPGCSRIGNIIVKIPDIGGGKNRQVILDIVFGGTELNIDAINKATGESLDVIFDCFDT